jgi:hypothetical protein
MTGVRNLQKRLRRLERARSPRTPIECWFGSLENFEAQTQAEIDAGRMCQFDGPLLIECIRRWHREELWRGWKRQPNRVLEYSR